MYIIFVVKLAVATLSDLISCFELAKYGQNQFLHITFLKDLIG